jgi:hypothetical protein
LFFFFFLPFVHDFVIVLSNPSSFLLLHHQLRIRVECAFGMLVHRWAILRAPIPRGITIKRTVAMVSALAKLHNFCIDENEDDVPALSPRDLVNVMANESGFLPSPDESAANSGRDVPLSRQLLLDGGNHFDDYIPRDERPRPRDTKTAVVLPRELLLEHVIDSHMVRPSTNVYKKE